MGSELWTDNRLNDAGTNALFADRLEIENLGCRSHNRVVAHALDY